MNKDDKKQEEKNVRKLEGEYINTSTGPTSLKDLEDEDQETFTWLVGQEVSFNERLKELISEKKEAVKRQTGKYPTQKEMAAALTVTEQTFTGWKKDKECKARDLKRLAEYFDVDPDYLLCRQTEKRKKERTKEGPKLEEGLEKIGFKFEHSYQPYDPSTLAFIDPEDDDEYTEYEETDENGEKHMRIFKSKVPTRAYLKVGCPSGKEIVLKEEYFDKYSKKVIGWMEVILVKLLEDVVIDHDQYDGTDNSCSDGESDGKADDLK